MKIYIMAPNADNYRWLEYCDNKWFDFFYSLLDSKPIGLFDGRIKCRMIPEKNNQTLGDYPNFSVPALSEKSENLLRAYFGNLVEIFPLETGKLGKFFFMNVINILDCLDEEKSNIDFLNPNKYMMINSYTFKEFSDQDLLKIFKLRKNERGEIYVSEQTKTLIEKSGLEGFKFTQVGDITIV